MENNDISRLLSQTADLMEIAAEDGFRIRSYRNAASAIEGYPERVASILADPARDVTEIPGVGKGLAAALRELVQRGSFERRDELIRKYPEGLLELLSIQGLGPKSIRSLWEEFGVSSIDDLERLAKEQKLRDLPRMSAKTEEKILQAIQHHRASSGRHLLPVAVAAAAEIGEFIRQQPGIEDVTAAGSLRRGKETVGDLDLLVTGPHAEDVLAKIVTLPQVKEVLGRGENKASVLYGPRRLQVDVRALPRESYGAALQYFTGNKAHNIALRQRAQKLGLTLNEYGLFRLDNGERVAGETEEEVYAALGLTWIPPEFRQNLGEIELAEMRKLPKFVEPGDIRGDLHMHTRESDGRASLEEMVDAAKALGYEYVAITDHSKALAMANGLDENRAVAFARLVREFNKKKPGIRVFSGIEVDIMKDGSMDLSEDALAELDFVVGSVHSHMNMDSDAMTERLLRALDSPSLKVVGHPTGRLLLQREAFPFDFDAIAKKAVKNGKWLEINSSPERLDLGGPLIRRAKELGAKFTISTDAHHPMHLNNISFGVKNARRGGLEPSDIMNTLPVKEFARAIGR